MKPGPSTVLLHYREMHAMVGGLTANSTDLVQLSTAGERLELMATELLIDGFGSAHPFGNAIRKAAKICRSYRELDGALDAGSQVMGNLRSNMASALAEAHTLMLQYMARWITLPATPAIDIDENGGIVAMKASNEGGPVLRQPDPTKRPRLVG